MHQLGYVSKVLLVFIWLWLRMSGPAWAQKENLYEQKPNIIWILSEDISTDLACYGTPIIKTPNLDKMAHDGIKYTNAFTTAPVCSPSRSAIITAMYQTSIGAHHHRSHRKDGYTLPEPVKPITEYLRQAGYYTVLAKNPAPGVQTPLKTDFNFTPKNQVYDGNDWKDRKPGQPFFAQMNMDESHRGKAWPTTVQQHQPQIDPSQVVLPPYYPNHPVAREDWATYLESIQLVDSYVGKVLARLQAEGIAENTLVIFSGDNGRCHVRDKQFLYDGGLHIPLLIKWPGKLPAGQVNQDMISAIDVSATILRLAGLPIPKYLDGQVMLGPEAKKREYIIGARDRMDETVDKMRAVRDQKFKYIKNYYPERPYMQPNNYKETQYPMWNLLKDLYAQNKLTPAQALFVAPTKPAEELYDIVNDPYELNNLAALPQHQATLKKMRGRLENWIKQTNDQGQYPEKPEAARLN